MMKIQCSGCAHVLLPTSTNPLSVCYASRCHHPPRISSALLGPDATYFPCHAFPLSSTRLSPSHNPPALKPNGPPTTSLLSRSRLHTKTHYLRFFPFTPGSGCPLVSSPYPPTSLAPQTSLLSLICLMYSPATPSQTPLAMALLVFSPKTRLCSPPSAQGRLPSCSL